MRTAIVFGLTMIGSNMGAIAKAMGYEPSSADDAAYLFAFILICCLVMDALELIGKRQGR